MELGVALSRCDRVHNLMTSNDTRSRTSPDHFHTPDRPHTHARNHSTQPCSPPGVRTKASISVGWQRQTLKYLVVLLYLIRPHQIWHTCAIVISDNIIHSFDWLFSFPCKMAALRTFRLLANLGFLSLTFVWQHFWEISIPAFFLMLKPRHMEKC